MLTLLTLGIYSAWATVRTNRYFYANLKLDGEGFEYLAKPLQILKGRIIAVILVLAYSVFSALSPVASGLSTVALLFAFPAAIVLSLRFTRRMTSYKNLQFKFDGSFGGAYKAFLLWPLSGILTLGILYPRAQVEMNKYVIENSAYGTQPFSFSGTYKDYGKLLLLIIAFYIGYSFLAGFSSAFIFDLASDSASPNLSLVLFPLITVPLYFMAFYVAAKYISLKINRTHLRENNLHSTVTGWSYSWLWMVNVFFIVITLGFYLPFAKVRSARYLADRVTLLATGPLDDFTASERENVSSVGHEVGSAFDLDIGIGL